MENPTFMFHKNSFQPSYNFTFVYFGALSFKFIQLNYLYKLLLNVVFDCPIFYFLSSKYLNLNKKNSFNNLKIFFIFFFNLMKVDEKILFE